MIQDRSILSSRPKFSNDATLSCKIAQDRHSNEVGLFREILKKHSQLSSIVTETEAAGLTAWISCNIIYLVASLDLYLTLQGLDCLMEKLSHQVLKKLKIFKRCFTFQMYKNWSAIQFYGEDQWGLQLRSDLRPIASVIYFVQYQIVHTLYLLSL